MSLSTTTEYESILEQSSYRSNSSFVNLFIVLAFLFFNIIFLWSIELEVLVKISFLLNVIMITSASWLTINQRETKLTDCVMIAFSYSFLWLAPLLQLDSGSFPYFRETNPQLIVLTNMIILVFLFSYFSFKMLLSTWFSRFLTREDIKLKVQSISDKSVFYFYIAISIVITILYFPTLINYLTSRASLISFSSEGQFIRKFLFYIPLFPLYFLLINTKKDLKIDGAIWIILMIYSNVIFLLFKNPFNEKRNAIGPLYLSVISIILNKKRLKTLNNRFYIGLMIFVLVLMFPIFSTLTHSGTALKGSAQLFVERIKANSIQTSLTTGDYDSWSMILSTYDYCKENGFTYGNQLLGNILFFVPRSLWPLKSYGSGSYIVNNYLWKSYGWNFANVSCPLPAEGYINFGIIGTILFAICLAILGIISDKYLKSEDIFKKIFAYFVPFQLVMLLRGDLNSGFAYLITPLLAIYFLPKLLRMFFYRLQFKH